MEPTIKAMDCLGGKRNISMRSSKDIYLGIQAPLFHLEMRNVLRGEAISNYPSVSYYFLRKTDLVDLTHENEAGFDSPDLLIRQAPSG